MSASAKGSKFKPAKASVKRPVQIARTGLASFSTPGFQNIPRPPPAPVATTKSTATPPAPLSSASRESSPFPHRSTIKRDSSDLSVGGNEIEVSAQKRVKTLNYSGNKENAPLEHTHNPLLAGHSHFLTTISKRLTHTDLGSKTVAELQDLYVSNLELSHQLLTCPQTDSVLVEVIRELVRERIRAIKDAQDASPGLQLTLATPVFRNASLHTAPIVNVTGSTSQRSPFPASSASIPTSTVSAATMTTPHVTSEDDEYWNSLDNISMDDLVQLEAEEGSSPLPRTGPAAASSTNPYYQEVHRCLKQVFQLRNFRPNQLDAALAILKRQDVFVLMPTGGGKSLCYQLPAVCSTTQRSTVTIVISPLIALMNDQVEGLLRRNILAVRSDSENFHDAVFKNKDKPVIWYLTPEKIRESRGTLKQISTLYEDGRIRLFAVDEAHCISTWGQDFREAYKGLGMFRAQFPDVPIMALTATADERTVKDITAQLGLRRDHVFLKQSFNRSNLTYLVRPKQKQNIDDIANYIKTTHPNQSGVIYCLARATCESVAQELCKRGLKATYYHADAGDHRQAAVRSWQSNEVHIVVATIAFGMGIDKPDVRFVIHRDLPKNLTGYYQETGRAGRDGKPSDCILYSSFADFSRLRKQIRDDPETPEERKQSKLAELDAMWRFCDNMSVCRRVLLLQHFGEKVDEKICKGLCDVCQETVPATKQDVTKQAQETIALVGELVGVRRDKLTKTQLNNIIRGGNVQEVRSKGHDLLDQFGCCSTLPKEILDLFLDRLLFLDILGTESIRNNIGYHNDYIVLGPEARSYAQGSTKQVVINYRPKPGKALKPRKPPQPMSRSNSRKPKRGEPEDDPISMYEDDPAFDHPDPLASEPSPSITQHVGHVAVTTGQLEHYRVTAVFQPPTLVPTASAPRPSEPLEEEEGHLQLYHKLIAVRAQVAKDIGVDESEIFDDEALQLLSFTAPDDYVSFTDTLQFVPDIRARFKRFGEHFLNICTEHAFKFRKTTRR